MATTSHYKLKPKKVGNALKIYGRLFGYVNRFSTMLIVATAASMLYSGVDAGFIYFLKPLLNTGLMEKNKDFLQIAPFIVLGIFIFRGIASFASNYGISSVSRSVIMCLRQDVFAHLQRVPARFYDNTTSGQIQAILLYGVEQVANASADVLTNALQAIFLIIGLVVVMFSISWKLTLLYFILVPFMAVIMRVTSLRIRRLSLTIQDSVGEVSHCAEENIEGYKVVRAFEGQAYEAQKFNKATKINRQREMKIVASRSISLSAIQLITAAALSLTLYIATLDVADSLLTPGGFVAMVTAMLAMLKPMKDLAFVQNKLYKGLAGAQTVFELLDEKPEEDNGQLPLQRAKGKIKFDSVHFQYETSKVVLDDVSFTVEPGQIVALVGRSGSGKSTLANLLPRFYEGYKGNILLDDVSIRDYQLKALRRQFAIVSQHVTLFHDTVANNIAYGRFNEVSREQIIEAAKAAHALEFIERLPNGFDSLIGENGVLLSGGQRQRLAIARAILKDAPILILDEATSALDTESEKLIQSALDELMRQRTTLVIAHRLSTVEHADKIIVMEDGKVVEVGTHLELLKHEGSYAKLYRMQFSEIPTVLEASNAV